MSVVRVQVRSQADCKGVQEARRHGMAVTSRTKAAGPDCSSPIPPARVQPQVRDTSTQVPFSALGPVCVATGAARAVGQSPADASKPREHPGPGLQTHSQVAPESATEDCGGKCSASTVQKGVHDTAVLEVTDENGAQSSGHIESVAHSSVELSTGPQAGAQFASDKADEPLSDSNTTEASSDSAAAANRLEQETLPSHATSSDTAPAVKGTSESSPDVAGSNAAENQDSEIRDCTGANNQSRPHVSDDRTAGVEVSADGDDAHKEEEEGGAASASEAQKRTTSNPSTTSTAQPGQLGAGSKIQEGDFQAPAEDSMDVSTSAAPDGSGAMIDLLSSQAEEQHSGSIQLTERSQDAPGANIEPCERTDEKSSSSAELALLVTLKSTSHSDVSSSAVSRPCSDLIKLSAPGEHLSEDAKAKAMLADAIELMSLPASPTHAEGAESAQGRESAGPFKPENLNMLTGSTQPSDQVQTEPMASAQALEDLRALFEQKVLRSGSAQCSSEDHAVHKQDESSEPGDHTSPCELFCHLMDAGKLACPLQSLFDGRATASAATAVQWMKMELGLSGVKLTEADTGCAAGPFTMHRLQKASLQAKKLKLSHTAHVFVSDRIKEVA